jgi:hypothetical protein
LPDRGRAGLVRPTLLSLSPNRVLPCRRPFSAPLATLEQGDDFIRRHIGPCSDELPGMLAAVGVDALDTLIQQTVPAGIRLPPRWPWASRAEHVALARLKTIAGKNVLKKSLIGMGYYDTITPKVILRNVMENPGWYTAYTPYQAEIAQGRLEALLNYQQMVIDLTGLELANASLLDEATAAAEAMAMARRISKVKSGPSSSTKASFPRPSTWCKTRAGYFGFELIVGPAAEAAHHDVFGALLQYPNERGEVADLSDAIAPQGQGRGGGRRFRPDGAGPAQVARAPWAPTSPWARPSASAFRWASAAPTPPSSPPAKPTCAPCRAASSACRRTPAARPPCA